ncbi:MAG: N-acetylmuramoyl-L-alanine amidase [Candidatus Acidiferrales bacterium]
MRKSLALYVIAFFALAVAICAPLKGFDLRATARLPFSQSSAAPAQVPVSPTLPPIISTSPGAPAEPPLTIVIDAAHGGGDDGARGANGVKEKDVVLALARGCRAELTQRGYRVVMTRDSDSDPSFDDRATIANQFANAFFVTLHIASTGTPNTVRVYYDRVAVPYTMPAATGAPVTTNPPASASQIELLPWRQAQASFSDASRRFADLVQTDLTQNFSGSPANGTSAAIRDLRSIATPAVAIEISNIGSPNVSALEQMSPTIGSAIGQAAAAIHSAPNANGTSNATGVPR